MLGHVVKCFHPLKTVVTFLVGHCIFFDLLFSVACAWAVQPGLCTRDIACSPSSTVLLFALNVEVSWLAVKLSVWESKQNILYSVWWGTSRTVPCMCGFVHMCVCVCVFVCVCVSVCVWVWVYVCVCVLMCMCLHAYRFSGSFHHFRVLSGSRATRKSVVVCLSVCLSVYLPEGTVSLVWPCQASWEGAGSVFAVDS